MKVKLIIFLMGLSAVVCGQVPPGKVIFVSEGAKIINNPDGSVTVQTESANVQIINEDNLDDIIAAIHSGQIKSPVNKDTIFFELFDDFHVPQIVAFNDGIYYCVDPGGNYLIKLTGRGEDVQKLNLSDILEDIRRKIGSVSPDSYLKINGISDEIDGIKVVPDARGYNKIVHIKGPSEHISRPTIHLMLRAFEIDTAESRSSNVMVNQFPLKNFEVLLEFDTTDFSLKNVYRLPELEKGLRYNVNAFHFTADSLLIVPIFPENEEDVHTTPVFAQVKFTNKSTLKIDKYFDKGLTQFSVSSGWYHFFFNPIFMTVDDAHYYIDQAEMCFYKVGEPDYRWCIPDLPTMTLQEILTSFRARTPIEDFKVTNEYLHMWIGIFEDNESKRCDFYSFKLDLKNKKIIDRQHLFNDSYGLTSGYRYIDGMYHKLLVDEDDAMKIIRFLAD